MPHLLRLLSCRACARLTPSTSCRPPTGTAASIAVGYKTACAVLTDGGTMCWGYNNKGQVGVGGTTDQTVPQPIKLASGAPSPTMLTLPRPALCLGPILRRRLAPPCPARWRIQPPFSVGVFRPPSSPPSSSSVVARTRPQRRREIGATRIGSPSASVACAGWPDRSSESAAFACGTSTC